VELTVQVPTRQKAVEVRPHKYGFTAEVTDGTFTLALTEPVRLACKFPGHRWAPDMIAMPDLYIFAEPPETNVPDRGDSEVIFLEGGHVHAIESIALKDNQSVYLEGGAVLAGTIEMRDVRNVSVSGRGIVTNAGESQQWQGRPRYLRHREKRRAVAACNSEGIRVAGVTIVDPKSWCVSTFFCRDVAISDVKILAVTPGRDGIDICSSRDVSIRNCFVRTGDDCIAMKSMDEHYFRLNSKAGDLADLVAEAWDNFPADPSVYDVRSVHVEGCVLDANRGGSAMEIGQEGWGNEVADIVWRDIDVLGVHGFASAFSIRNSDRATVRNIRYEDIRVEHHFCELIGFHIYVTRYTVTPERGRIENVHFKDIDVTVDQFNLGYSPSHLRGHDPEHGITNVCFENFRYGGKAVKGLDDFGCFRKYATGITFG
jgi:polygalacturonase